MIVAIEDPWGFGETEPLVLHPESGPTDAEVALQPAGALEIRETNLQLGAPVLLYAIPKDRRAVPRIRRVFPGRSEFLNGLEPGYWDLQLAEEGSRSNDRQHVEIVAGETRTVEWSRP